MSGAALFWLAATSLAFWIAMAFLHAGRPSRDSKPHPIGWGRRMVVGLVVTAPMLAVLPAIATDREWLLISTGLATAVAWWAGKRLPQIGNWFALTAAREDERSRKGIL